MLMWGNDPINVVDPTGTTCTASGDGDKITYTCQIDQVANVEGHNSVGTRPPTDAENKTFAAFNRRYTAAVNRLMSHPDRKVTVGAITGKAGSFDTTAGKAAAALISRQFIYADKGGADGVLLGTPGGPGEGQAPRTYVFGSAGLGTGEVGIVHDGGLHGTPEENTGGLQRPGRPLAHLDHQTQYNDAACSLL